MWDRSPNMNDKLLLDRSNVSAFNRGVEVEIDDDIIDNNATIDYCCSVICQLLEKCNIDLYSFDILYFYTFLNLSLLGL